jgi:hypothetical protein
VAGAGERQERTSKSQGKSKNKRTGLKTRHYNSSISASGAVGSAGSQAKLMAAATAAAAGAAASGRGRGRFGRAAGDGGAKNGKLECGFFAGAFGAGDFLLLVQDEFFELRFAVVADVFVDGHALSSLMGLEFVISATQPRHPTRESKESFLPRKEWLSTGTFLLPLSQGLSREAKADPL